MELDDKIEKDNLVLFTELFGSLKLAVLSVT